MSIHHLGSLLKKTAIAKYNHNQTYTCRNVIEESYGRIGKHLSPLSIARVIALDTDYGIPYLKNNASKVQQLKVFQENFNVAAESKTTKVQAWEKLNSKEFVKIDGDINHVRLSDGQFEKLKAIATEMGSKDKNRKFKTFENLKADMKLNKEHFTPVKGPILSKTKDTHTFLKSQGTLQLSHLSSGFSVASNSKNDYPTANNIKVNVIGLRHTPTGVIPVVAIQSGLERIFRDRKIMTKPQNRFTIPDIDEASEIANYFEKVTENK